MSNEEEQSKPKVEAHSQPSELANLEVSLTEGLNMAMEEANPKSIDIQSYFAFLGGALTQESYAGLTLTPAQLTRAKNHMQSMKHGTYASAPLVCQGAAKCPISSQCFYNIYNADGTINLQDSVYPMLRPCPVELKTMEMKVHQYINHVIVDDKVELSPIVMTLVTKLAELDIHENRCNMVLSKGDHQGNGRDMLAPTVEAISESTGKIHWGVKEHPILAMKDRIDRQRERIWTKLMATPDAKFNAAIKQGLSNESNDLSTKLGELSEKLTRMQRAQDAIDV